MTSPLDNDIGLEKTILQVAEKLAKTCGFTNPKAEIDENATDWYSKIYSIDAQNGYGATVRANFVVTFTFASKDTYSVALCTVS